MGQSVPRCRFEPGTSLIQIRRLTLELVGSGHSVGGKRYRWSVSYTCSRAAQVTKFIIYAVDTTNFIILLNYSMQQSPS